MQPEQHLKNIGITLLASTLSAMQAIQADDWETANHLLRRREQLLTQLERFPDLKPISDLLLKIQKAENDLMQCLEDTTQAVHDELRGADFFTKAIKTYKRPTKSESSYFEKYG